MLFYIVVSLVVIISLYLHLTKTESAWGITGVLVVISFFAVFVTGMIAAEFAEDKITVREMDDDTIYNEQFGDDYNYYTYVDGQRVNIPDDDRTTFDVGSANEIREICDIIPSWVLPWEDGPCRTEVVAENVE